MLTPSPIRSPSLSSTTSPKLDADAELDPPLGRQAGVALDHAALHFDRAAHRVHHAAELNNGSIAGSLDDAAMVHGDNGINQIAADRPKPRQRTIFVRAGKPAVTDYGSRSSDPHVRRP